jgi:hypothetical protein
MGIFTIMIARHEAIDFIEEDDEDIMAKESKKTKQGKVLNKTQHQYLIERLREAADELEAGNAHATCAMFGRMQDYLKTNPDADLYDFIVWMTLNVDHFIA